MATTILILRSLGILVLFAFLYSGVVFSTTNKMEELEKDEPQPLRIPLMFIGSTILLHPLLTLVCNIAYKLLFL